MDFWLACEDYKKTASPGLETRAKQIYQQYVEADAANEVIGLYLYLSLYIYDIKC